jgi:aldehyde:ferredoxin oxidoreductase
LDGGGSELVEIFNDSAVYCNFNSFGLPRNLRFDFYKAVTGLTLTRKEWYSRKGMKTLHLQRAMLLLGGSDVRWNPKVHDDNPPRYYEPLPSGPYKGQAVDKNKVGKERKRYYKAVGWDENGIPTAKALRNLGLDDVDEVLEKLRLRQ